MESGQLTKVLNDFFTVVEGELSLSKGDYFLIHYVIDKHWCYGESGSKTGSFPTNHLHKVDLPEFNDCEQLFVAIAPFRGEQVGDLSFGQGDLIIGEQEIGCDWYSGRTDSRTGIFPLTHVWLLNPSILKKPSLKKNVRKKARVKTSLKAQLDEELDLSEGEIVTVLEILDDGWALGITSDGRTGTFPEGFVTYIDVTDSNVDHTDQASAIIMDPFPESVVNGGRIFKDFNESIPNTFDEEPAPSYYDLFPDAKPSAYNSAESNLPDNEADNTNVLGVQPYAITLYPFNAQFPNELNFEAGEVVHLIKHIDSEWSEGTIDKETGIFPSSYVNIIVDCCENNIEQVEINSETAKSHKQLSPGDMVKVLYTFNAQMSGDLSVTEGEIVTVVEIANNDWLSVKTQHGDVGLCPRGYLSDESQSTLEGESDLEDFVVIRNPELVHEINEQKLKRLSEPHRPAPPAPVPGSIPLQKQSVTDKTLLASEELNHQDNEVNETEAAKKKKYDQRQNVISELVITEKEYVRDLKITYETFHLYDPNVLEVRGIDVATLFGNILEVIHVAEELLDSLQKAMKGIDEGCQMISPCFIKMADKLQSVYVKYCSSHEAALMLLKKYEDNRDIMVVFEKGIETLRYQIACFDMSSILIKPVQRIVKYPLMLVELSKSTEEDHPDKLGIEDARAKMTDVASYINEYKRRRDIISKYFDCDKTLMSKMSKLNMHSVAKKSSRLGAKLASTLGLTNIPPDPTFEELEKQFKSLEKCVWQLGEDIEQCLTYLSEDSNRCEMLANYINQYHSGVNDNEVYQYYQMRVLVSTRYMSTFKEKIDKNVVQPMNLLINLMQGPTMLITKRHDKMLDYDNAISKADKNKESRIIQDELINAKTNYEALNQQLLEELPIIIDGGTKIIVACIQGFTNARKLLNGRIMKQYLSLPKSTTQLASEDIFQSFLVTHNLLWNQLSRFSFAGINSKAEESKVDIAVQGDKERILVKKKFTADRLYAVQENLISTSDLDLGAAKGTIVGVIKTQDPMGDVTRWFVDNGTTQGFMPRNVLRPLVELQSSSSGILMKNNDVVDSRTNPPDLISLESPEKTVNLISLDSPEKKHNVSPNPSISSQSSSQSCWYLNIDDIKSDNSQNLPQEQASRYENVDTKFYYAAYDFNAEIPGTIAVRRGQALKLIRRNDEKGNTEWWLMEDRDGKTGYVPSNYLNLYHL